MVKNKTEAPAEEKAKAGFCQYLGPTLVGVIQKGTIYEGEKAAVLKLPAVKLALEKCPAIADLVIPGDMLPEAIRKVQDPGDDLHRKYKKIANYK